MKKMIIAISLLFISSSIYAVKNPFNPTPDSNSASYSEGGFSPMINPVFADIDSNPTFAYRYWSYDGEKTGNHFTSLRFWGISFIYGYYNHQYIDGISNIQGLNASYYNISKGIMLNESFGIGAAYSFSSSNNSQYNRLSSWNFGFLLRPARALSLGIAFRDAASKINGSSITPKDVYSVSVRPFGESFTLSTDFIHDYNKKYSSFDYSISAELKMWREISLFTRYDINKNLTFGATIPFVLRGETISTISLDYYRSANRGMKNYNSAGIAVYGSDIKNATSLSPKKNILVIRLKDTINDSEKSTIFRSRKLSFFDISNSIKKASQDPTIDGIMLEIDSAGLGFARIQELKREIKNFRKSGKPVYAYLSEIGNKEYLLATAADRIYFTPGSTFSLTGLKAEVYFFKGLMDKVGVKFESIKHGKFKSFNEGFTLDKMSDEARENLTTLLTDLNTQFIEEISSSRNISRKDIESLFTSGTVRPDEAKRLGFVNDVLYSENVMKQFSENTNPVELDKYAVEREKKTEWGFKPAIAIIYIQGSIVRGKSSGSGIFASDTGDDTYIKMAERAFRDPRVKAIVIRINSGGGSASASDRMWSSIIKLKKTYNKPLVFSFGDIAASGGYYAACTGDKIFAENGTITGSIGVIFGKISLKELYAKLGINKETIRMSEFADIFNESRDLTAKEKEIIQTGIDFSYESFTGKVMEARKIDKSKIASVAEGRVFSGSQAKSNGLIDETGGLITALEYAGSIAKIYGRYDVFEFPSDTKILTGIFDSEESAKLPLLFRNMFKNMEHTKFGSDEYLYLIPYNVEIK